MRTPIIAGNWKMYKTTGEAIALLNELKPLVRDIKGVEIVVAPVFTVLNSVKEMLVGSPIKLSAQDCYWEKEGAYTGEVSPQMLVDVGCSHVIIGHSERRQYFGEIDDSVNKKLKAAVQAGLKVIFCIGETLVERESGKTWDILAQQINGGLADFHQDLLVHVIIAYEPVWAIGTGKTASEEQAQEAHAFIRNVIKDLYSSPTSESIRILYGGSVKPENIKGLMAQKDIDGALVGGASLKAESFAAIACFEGK